MQQNSSINRASDALIIIDPQIDFCPNGALAVAGGDEIMAPISEFSAQFDEIIITQDWHPADHASFAVDHENVQPFQTITLDYGEQVAWPAHCVQGTQGADFHPDLHGAVQRAKLIIRKGYRPHIDSYSAFYENDRRTSTGLAGYLREKGIKRLFLAGLAYDFCVAYSALDAAAADFEVIVRKDLSRAISQDTASGMEAKMRAAGVDILD